jgi:outer membrane biosynthesis protein TonB
VLGQAAIRPSAELGRATWTIHALTAEVGSWEQQVRLAALSRGSLSGDRESSVNPQASSERNGLAGLIARPPESPKPAHSPKAVGPICGAPRNPAPRGATPATGAASHSLPPSTILVTAPAYGSKLFRVTFPEKPIAASSSVAMTSELSVLVPPQRGPAAAHKPARLQPGELVFFVWPRYPRTGDRYGSAETIKVRVTIGQLGQVQDIRFVRGSTCLLPATTSALRLWHYEPTLLNKRPVQVQQDVTIEFRPPQYLSQVRTQHPSHKERGFEMLILRTNCLMGRVSVMRARFLEWLHGLETNLCQDLIRRTKTRSRVGDLICGKRRSPQLRVPSSRDDEMRKLGIGNKVHNLRRARFSWVSLGSWNL